MSHLTCRLVNRKPERIVGRCSLEIIKKIFRESLEYVNVFGTKRAFVEANKCGVPFYLHGRNIDGSFIC